MSTHLSGTTKYLCLHEVRKNECSQSVAHYCVVTTGEPLHAYTMSHYTNKCVQVHTLSLAFLGQAARLHFPFATHLRAKCVCVGVPLGRNRPRNWTHIRSFSAWTQCACAVSATHSYSHYNCMHKYSRHINQCIYLSMALSASCAGHTRTQSHVALFSEIIVRWWRQRLYKYVGFRVYTKVTR